VFAGIYLDFICDEIFAYSDYESLTKAKKVSAVWTEMISKGRVWKVMVERKVILSCVISSAPARV
jgi:hypothetical protein